MSILEVTSGQVGQIFQYSKDLFSDLSIYLVAIIGIPLAFWVIRKVIALIRAR